MAQRGPLAPTKARSPSAPHWHGNAERLSRGRAYTGLWHHLLHSEDPADEEKVRRRHACVARVRAAWVAAFGHVTRGRVAPRAGGAG